MILTVALAFFLVFMFQTIGGIMIGNILYYIVLMRTIFLRRSVRIKRSPIRNGFLVCFVSWSLLSTVLFALERSAFDGRNAIQFIFTMQYLVFVVDIEIDSKLLEEWLFRFSVMLSIVIIALYLFTGEFQYFSSLFTTRRLWAQNFVPGWPNTTAIPLIIGLWLGMKKNCSRIFRILMITALVLTSSRVAMLGILAIYMHRFFLVSGGKLLKWFMFTPIIFGFSFLYDHFLSFLNLTIPSLAYRLSVIYDRQDILRVTMKYVSERPLLGYGGNSLDQLNLFFGNISLYGIDWGHTHNWVLEMLLRYGTIGLVLFSAFMIISLLEIIDTQRKFMFGLLLLLGLFQTYLRNFNVLFLMFFLTMKSNESSLLENKEAIFQYSYPIEANNSRRFFR